MFTLLAIAKSRGECYADKIGKFYRANKHKGSIVMGIVQIPNTTWLSVADPDLHDTVMKCVQPVCPTCKRITPCRSISIPGKKQSRTMCNICDSEMEWQVFHDADNVDDAFWNSVALKLSEKGLFIHGDTDDDRYFYISDGRGL